MSARDCDCGTCCDSCGHASNCTSNETAYDTDTAAQVAAEDGFPRSRSTIRHPLFASTRAHFAASPLPVQQGRRAS
ncbi:hypothetical protein RM572_21695 [Streptomyces sp. DSM 42041]|uniref:Uncharacterized protein n=1 Tax=Streptomyces hazeniae TaxID=3075538 RepID=A0ABU2NWK3_9ACTN|nr:hypothetical protein [Streptomyces sp. DSM 42041]MDT0381375.1 hypothetical protein [Streptomyces sp. DSM 42041]